MKKNELPLLELNFQNFSICATRTGIKYHIDWLTEFGDRAFCTILKTVSANFDSYL